MNNLQHLIDKWAYKVRKEQREAVKTTKDSQDDYEDGPALNPVSPIDSRREYEKSIAREFLRDFKQ